jgi:hypothetical protein
MMHRYAIWDEQPKGGSKLTWLAKALLSND